MTHDIQDEEIADLAVVEQFEEDLQALDTASSLADLKTVAAISQRVLMDNWDDRCTPLAQALARIADIIG